MKHILKIKSDRVWLKKCCLGQATLRMLCLKRSINPQTSKKISMKRNFIAECKGNKVSTVSLRGSKKASGG